VTLDDLAALFASPAMGLNYGEALSIRDHMLQCAALAATRGLPDALIAAALLHDIGWALPTGEPDHETSGADLLAGLFGEAVIAPIRAHVDAKRWLVANRPGYGARLSIESRRTLVLQGGPMDEDESAAFARAPWFAEAIALREIDDHAKDPEAAAPPFAKWRPMLGRLVVGV